MKKAIVCLLSVFLVLALTAGTAGAGVLALNVANIPVLTRYDCAAATGKPRIEWNAVANATGYQVYRSEAVNGKFTKVGSPTKTGATDNSARPGVTYYYKVRSLFDGGKYGKFCEIVEITCLPARPDASVAVNADSGKPVVTWSAADGAASYQVYRTEGTSGTYTRLAATSQLSYTDTAARPGVVYSYKVRSVCANGVTGSFSSKASKTAKCAKPLATGTNVKSTGKPRLNWEPVDGAVKYQVYRAATLNGQYTRIGNPTKNGATDTTALPGRTYYYKVRAMDANGGTGAFSSVTRIRCGGEGSGDIYTPEIPIH